MKVTGNDDERNWFEAGVPWFEFQGHLDPGRRDSAG